MIEILFSRFVRSVTSERHSAGYIAHLQWFYRCKRQRTLRYAVWRQYSFARLQRENLLSLSVAMGQRVTTIVGMCFIVDVSSDVVDLPKETKTANKRRSFGCDGGWKSVRSKSRTSIKLAQPTATRIVFVAWPEFIIYIFRYKDWLWL